MGLDQGVAQGRKLLRLCVSGVRFTAGDLCADSRGSVNKCAVSCCCRWGVPRAPGAALSRLRFHGISLPGGHVVCVGSDGSDAPPRETPDSKGREGFLNSLRISQILQRVNWCSVLFL